MDRPFYPYPTRLQKWVQNPYSTLLYKMQLSIKILTVTQQNKVDG